MFQNINVNSADHGRSRINYVTVSKIYVFFFISSTLTKLEFRTYLDYLEILAFALRKPQTCLAIYLMAVLFSNIH